MWKACLDFHMIRLPRRLPKWKSSADRRISTSTLSKRRLAFCDRLLSNHHFAVFGPPGSGKTTLRLKLEYRGATFASSAANSHVRAYPRCIVGPRSLHLWMKSAKMCSFRPLERFNAVAPDKIDSPTTVNALAALAQGPLSQLAPQIAGLPRWRRCRTVCGPPLGVNRCVTVPSSVALRAFVAAGSRKQRMISARVSEWNAVLAGRGRRSAIQESSPLSMVSMPTNGTLMRCRH